MWGVATWSGKAVDRVLFHASAEPASAIGEAELTLTFHLGEPDPDFPYKLALPYAYAVPAVARPRTVCRSLRTGTASEDATLPPCAGGCVGAPPRIRRPRPRAREPMPLERCQHMRQRAAA